jgi:hypothetical protein
MRVPVILRFEDGREVKTSIYITSVEWGWGEPSFIERVRKVLYDVISELASREVMVMVCYPTIQEVLSGRVYTWRYATRQCADVARRVLELVYRRLAWDP